MEDNVQTMLLMDFYGALLTDRQREALSLHLEEDLSYAEIAQEMGITRQGAADAAGAAREKLTQYEAKLGLLSKHLHRQKLLTRAIGSLNTPGADELRAILTELIEEEDHGV